MTEPTLNELVTHPRHVERLVSLDCDYGQGYFFSKPIPEDQARHLLATAPFERG